MSSIPPDVSVTREQTLLEEIINALTHGLGALLSIAAAAVLITYASFDGDVWKIVGVSIYSASLILLYLASTLYHGIQHPPTKILLNLFDHCAIYLLIAGTYTPFVLVNLRHGWGWWLFGAVWGLALIGMVLRLGWQGRFARLHLINYLLMGWLIAFAANDLMMQMTPMGLSLLIAGGLSYSFGVIFFTMDRVPYAHAVWHLFVLGGSVCHYIAVFHDVIWY